MLICTTIGLLMLCVDTCLFMSLRFLTILLSSLFYFFFFNDTATTEIYTLSLHDALPIYRAADGPKKPLVVARLGAVGVHAGRSEEHTSELQSPVHLVCRLLLEKKKKKKHKI